MELAGLNLLSDKDDAEKVLRSDWNNSDFILVLVGGKYTSNSKLKNYLFIRREQLNHGEFSLKYLSLNWYIIIFAQNIWKTILELFSDEWIFGFLVMHL
jgi:hypothetical protein